MRDMHNLVLCNIHIEGTVLETMLCQPTSLRKLRLSSIEIARNSWRDVFMAIEGLDHVDDMVAQRLSVIDHYRPLEDIEYYYLTSVHVAGRINIITFLDACANIRDPVLWDSENDENAVFFPKGEAWTEASIC